jgi:exosome complex RNA-binding protein Csl4
MTDNCIDCGRVVRKRQEAVTCDACDRWQHRKCNTGELL